MTRRSGKSQVAVERLLEERRQYVEWLAKLDAPESAAVAAAVKERVKGDYAGRLDNVTRQLARFEGELQATLAELEQRRDEMTAQRAARDEALAEVRLRHGVGEYDEGQFAELSAEHAAFLAQIGEDLEMAARDIARIEEVLGLIAGVLPDAEPAEVAPSPTPVAEAEAPPARVTAEPAPLARARPSTEIPSPAIPPARASGAVRVPLVPPARASGAVEAPVVPIPTVPPPESAAAAAPQIDALDELEFLRAVAGGSEAAPKAEPGAPEPPPAPTPQALSPVVVEPPAAPPTSEPPSPAPPAEAPGAAARPEPPARASGPAAGKGGKRNSEPVARPASGPAIDDAKPRAAERAARDEPEEPGERDEPGTPTVPANGRKGPEKGNRPPASPWEADESSKTLRCTECGTYNLATEWYCEKCGAELSAF